MSSATLPPGGAPPGVSWQPCSSVRSKDATPRTRGRPPNPCGQPVSRPSSSTAVTRARARQLAERTLVTTKRATLEFVEDRGHRSAAQMSFFAILSFIPLVLLLAAAFGLLFDDGAVQERIIQTVFDNVPLSSGDDRPQLEKAVGDALDQAGNLGIFTTLLLLAAASGVMGALRHSINEAWDIEQRPPLLQRKALDLALVLGGTSILSLIHI